MSLFQLSGIASGVDSKSMIEQLMALERQPILKLRTRQEKFKSTNAAYQGVFTKMSSLATKVESLAKLETVSSRTISSSDNTRLTANATATAALGTYSVTVKQLATATTVSSASGNGTAINGSTVLTSLLPGNGTTLTTGSFTIGGAKISINSTSATIDHVLAAINSASNGTTVAGYDAAMVSFDISGGNTGLTNTAASLDATTGQLKLTGGGGVSIGSGADTSNFLSKIAGLTTGTVSGGDLVGHRMSAAQTSKKLSEGAAATNLKNHAMLGATGSFTINNVAISWTSDDTLNGIIKKINDSSAGVSASYNAVDDKLVLTNKSTGNTAVSISADTGRFLEAMGITSATTQTLGKNAEIIVDGMNGGSPIARTTNTISDVISGVTLNLAKADAAEKVTITVGENTSGTVSSVKGVISEFNGVIAEIDNLVKKGGKLQYDASLQQLRQSLTAIFIGHADGLVGGPDSLIDLGLNSGEVGAAVGTTSEFSLDEDKFNKALADNPSRVLDILGKVSSDGKPQGIMAKLEAYVDNAIGSNGLFKAKESFTTSQTQLIDKQIEAMDRRMEEKRSTLEKRFLRMETAVAKMNAQRDRLMSQLSSLQSGLL